MSEGNLLDQQQHQSRQHHHHHHHQSKLFSSRDSELEALDTTTPTTSSPEIRSRSQSVGSAHREALLFFEQNRLFQNSPELEYGKARELYDCELRSISSCSRTSSPANRFIDHHQASGSRGLHAGISRKQQQQQSSTSGLLCHQQQVQYGQQASSFRQQSDSNLLESSTAAGANNQRNNSDCFETQSSSQNTSGRARSQSQGQCGNVRRKPDHQGSHVIVVHTTNQKGGGGESVTQKASQWFEEIQFTAQYQHYRTNNYASVVSSASSLDKSDGGTSAGGTGGGGAASTSSTSGDQPQQYAGPLSVQARNKQRDSSEAESRSRNSGKPVSCSSSSQQQQQQAHHYQRHRHHSHQLPKSGNQERILVGARGGGEEEEEQELQPNTTSDDLNRQNSITTKQCWNFPRVKLRKLFTAKSLDDILGARSNAGGASRRGARKSLPLASVSSTRGEVSESDPRSSSSPEIVCRTSNPKKAQLLRDNKLSLPRSSRHDDDKSHLLFVKPVRDGSKSPGAHSSKSAIVISSTTGVAAKHRKAPTFIKATRQKSRSFSALTSALLSRVPGHTSSTANSPCSSSTSSTTGTGLSVFFTKRSHQQDKNVPPVIPAKKAGHVPCAKSDNCLNRFVASATCAKFVDYFSETSARVSKSATSTTTLVEPFGHDQYPGTPSSSSATGGGQTSTSSVAVVTAQPRKWTAIKNKWDQKLQASGDRQKEIGASLASVSNNAQIFRKSHHQHHQQRQRSSSLSPLDNPDEGKSTESLLEITSPSPTLQEVRFLDTPEIRYASPIAVRSSRGDFSAYGDDDDDSDSLTEGAHCSVKLGKDKDTTSTTACSSDTESFCSECKENDDEESEDMTRHHKSGAAAGGGGGTKRSRDHHHHHRHSKHHGQSSSKEKPKLVVANVTYLQRPMSPGLLLRDPSPSSAASGTMDQFGNVVGGSGDTAGGNLSSTVIRNNVFTSNNNNNQQSKSQQAKLEFLKGFSHSSQQPQQQQTFPRRNHLFANTSANVNENRSGGGGGGGYFGGAFSTSISPSSSGASEKDNNAYGGSSRGLGANTIVRGGNVQGGGGMHPQPLFQVDDLQNPLNRRAAMFADNNLRSSVGDPLVTMGGGGGRDSGRGPTSLTMKSTKCVTDDEESPPRYGAEQCSLGNQSFFGSSERHHQGAMGSGGGGSSSSDTMQSGMGFSTNYGARTTDSQSTGSDPDNRSGNAGGGGHTQLTTVEPSFSLNQGPVALAQSTVNNNLYIDVDLEGTEDTMGDLQSPQYVKRTAHMFDSRFSTEHGAANGHERNVRNPSYLNVSRSVSGYSCLTYNNGTVTSESVSNKTLVGNGTSLLSGGTRVGTAATRLKTDFAIHSPFSRKVVHTDEDSDHSSSQSATSPPPSLPPINTTSTRFTESPFFNNGMSRGNDLMDETPYIPSHGKSFIMQRIERLYGSDAVTNKGALTRKSSNVTTISITRESPPRGTERIIPIKVESRDDHQNNLYNNGAVSQQHEISTEEQVVVLPGEGGNVESIRRVQHRLSRDSFDDTDEDEDGIRTTSHTSPTKVRSPTGLDNSGHLNGNGNANPYGNGVAGGAHNGQNGTFEDRIPSDLPTDGNVKLIHANGNHHAIEVEGQDCTSMKKALSRESSAESDVTNECSENSLELGVSDAESKRTVYRKDSQDDSLYSSRGSTSPSKPKPKPKPKDMALLRTLSRSPALKTETENLDKTVISLNIVQPESTRDTDHIQTIVIEDQTDADSNSTLSDIKNTISAAAKVIPESKSASSDKESHHGSPDKENARSSPAESLGKIETTPEVKDGNYFKKEMTRVTSNILKFSEHAAKELDSLDPSEDRAGSIHAAIGKGNLLVKKKFKQFDELCDANLKGAAAEGPETTNEDLAGFWDMVLIQVDQIYNLFADLERKEQDEPEPRTPVKSASPKRAPVSTTKSTSKTSVGATPRANSAAAKARDEARRKMIAEKRRAMKNQMQEAQETTTEVNETEVQIFAPETPQTG